MQELQQLERGLIPIGYTEDMETVFLELDETNTIRVMIIAITREGKTFLLKGISDQLNLNNILLLYPNDKHREGITFLKPNTNYMEQFKYGLNMPELPNARKDDEEQLFSRINPYYRPRGIPNINFFSPEFCKTPDTTPFSYSIANLDKTESEILFGVRRHERNRKMAVKAIRSYFIELRENDIELDLTDEDTFKKIAKGIINKAEKFEMFEGDTTVIRETIKNEIWRYYDSFIEEKIMEAGNYINILDMMRDEDGGYTNHAIIDWSGANEAITDEERGMYDTYTSHFMRKVFEFRKRTVLEKLRNGLPECAFILDEFGKIVEKDRDTLTKRICKTIQSEGGKFGMSLIIAFQNLSGVDESLFANTRYFFVSKNNTTPSAYNLLKNSFRNVFEHKDDMMTFLDMQPHEFLLIDKKENTATIMKAFPPLSQMSYTAEE